MKNSSKLDDPYHGIQALVFGASGAIGRWVARMLCARGAKVSLVVRNKGIAEQIFLTYGIHGDVYELDLQDLEAVTKLLQKVKPAITFNLAGYGMDRSERDNSAACQINVRLVEAILATIAKRRDSKWLGQDIVHAGSSLEYGPIGGNLPEDAIPNPTTLYGTSKLAGTELLARCCKTHDIKGVAARIFTVYGPGDPPRRLLPSLLEAAKTGKPLPLTSGEQKRDFIYIEDVAEGLVRLGLARTALGAVVNLATGRLTSVRSFAETAAKIIGIPHDRLQFGKLPSLAEEMHHSEVTTERLRRLASWVPPTGIAEGIRKTVDRLSFSRSLSNGSPES
jgi:nucleoside-diphosphate-sugar epimerase